MGCEAYIDNDLAEDPWCQSCIDSYSDITEEDTDDDYLTADEEEVWFLAYEEADLSIFVTPSWDIPTFDHFVALSFRMSFFDRHFYKSISMEQDEEYAELMLNW